MSAGDGPRIAALAFDGWDTHANEGGPVGRLATLLAGLDGALAEFETGLGERWRDTVIVVATEFGRTAKINAPTTAPPPSRYWPAARSRAVASSPIGPA